MINVNYAWRNNGEMRKFNVEAEYHEMDGLPHLFIGDEKWDSNFSVVDENWWEHNMPRLGDELFLPGDDVKYVVVGVSRGQGDYDLQIADWGMATDTDCFSKDYISYREFMKGCEK